jgi:HPr kinase/phosphorylase
MRSPASIASIGSGLHATAVVYGESGVVILGESGSGKSALALALLARAKMTGRFGALIGDDRVWVRAAHRRLVASGAPHMAGLIERRGAGVLSARSEPIAVIRLSVELSGLSRSWPRWPSQSDQLIVEGIGVPRLALDSSASAVDNAITIDERLEHIAATRGDGRGISLEQCTAVHKNRKLAVPGRLQRRRRPEPDD